MSEATVTPLSSGVTAEQERYLARLFRGVRHTLLNRGVYQQLQDGSFREVVWKRTLLFPDLGVVAFEVDTLRLPVKIEQLLAPDVAHQMQAALGGRKVKVTNSRGLAFSVALEPEEPQPKVYLPRRVALNLDDRPTGVYMIPVGVGESGSVWRSLLNTGHILVGGESGSGKSTWLNAMLVALLMAHTPQELQVAIVDPKQVEFQVFRGIPPELQDELKSVARKLGVTVGEVARTFIEHGLEAYQQGNLELRPVLTTGKHTLFPGGISSRKVKQ